VLHFEGADAIDTDLDALYVFYNGGLRALGISWSRVNEFAHGVPYWFPHSPDIGPGLSAAGREFIHACNELGILIDVSHLNEHGFWDIETLSNAPLVASHSGVYALCPTTRNLTDKQLDAIGASNGVVGVNFHVAFLRTDGRPDENTPMMEIVRHIDYIVERIGIDHVAFGSDFDGATMPAELRDASGFPKLLLALHDRGYDEASLEKLTYKNWIRVFRNTWKEQ
jgi:membrane dipeptidase